MSTTHPAFLPPFDLYLFGRGEHWDLYRFLGAHPVREGEMSGWRFAVWAPNAAAVSVVGEWNGWAPDSHPLYPVGSSGIWAAVVPGLERGALYKFAIRGNDGQMHLKTDPLAFAAELRPSNAAVLTGLSDYGWNDGAWMERRAQGGLPLSEPVSIYEVHAGSWQWAGDHYGSFLNYRDLADRLVPYVRDLGFTHLEFMPLAEHPLDQSWGYQTSHYFAPTSRYGSPDELKYLIDRCHQAGLGVILDWVPGHFPKDAWSLGRFDGSALYEHANPQQGEHPDWGTYIFNYSRHEVRNFLLANALYWLKEFHFDGLRIDAVASMLYLDYSRHEGQWVPNYYGGRENLDAVEFLRTLNTVVHDQHPGALMVAEESTSWPGVSRPVYTGGLGFSFKWNMGWMHDTLGFFGYDPIFRAYHMTKLTFSMLYAFTENFVLPVSHDEVVHGKGALLAKMPGDYWQKFANQRLFFSYMWAHPGKKLIFMGQEFGQWSEWNEMAQLDWALYDFPAHRGLAHCVRDLNRLLASEAPMHAVDFDWQGFEWIDFSDHNATTVSFLRRAGSATLLWIFNLTPVVRHHYCVGCPQGGFWREVFNSDSEYYGGSNVGNHPGVTAKDAAIPGGWPHYLELTLPPLAALCLRAE